MNNPGPVCTAEAATTHFQGLRHCICWSGPSAKGFGIAYAGQVWPCCTPGAQCISCATQLSRSHASYQGFGIACAGQEWPCCAPRCSVHLPAVPYCCPCHMAHPAELQRAQRRGDELHADHLLIYWGYPGTSAVRSYLRGAYTVTDSVRLPTRGSHCTCQRHCILEPACSACIIQYAFIQCWHREGGMCFHTCAPGRCHVKLKCRGQEPSLFCRRAQSVVPSTEALWTHAGMCMLADPPAQSRQWPAP